MGYKYAYQGDQKTTARAAGTDIPVSTKSTIMVANFIRGKSVTRAQRDLGEVLKKKMAVPFTRFTDGAGHKPGIGPGKYPIKATTHVLSVINAAAANARDRGFGDDLTIVSVTVHQAARQMRYGRLRGRQRKGTHIEVVVAESEEKTTRKTPQKVAKKAEVKPAKAEAKPKAAEKTEAKPKPKTEAKPKAEAAKPKAAPKKAEASEPKASKEKKE